MTLPEQILSYLQDGDNPYRIASVFSVSPEFVFALATEELTILTNRKQL